MNLKKTTNSTRYFKILFAWPW